MVLSEGRAREDFQLVVFRCKELYVYKVPPAGTLGHRAIFQKEAGSMSWHKEDSVQELWDVDHWLQGVSMKIVVQQDDCTIQLFDLESGELFAECPTPKPDEASLSTVVDPVVDSSRYFVLKLQDRDSKRHAFIGIGFRAREEASDFNGALADHRQALRRTQEAVRLRQEYEAKAAERKPTADGTIPSDLALEPGQTMTLRLKAAEISDTRPKTIQAGRRAQDCRKHVDDPRLPAPPSAPGHGKKNGGLTDKMDADERADDWGEFTS